MMDQRNVIVGFYVPGTPVPKARPRVTRFGNAYTPIRTTEAEGAIRAAFAEALEALSFPPGFGVGSATVYATFYFPYPKVKKGQPLPVRMVKRPDLDNLVKLVLDGIQWTGGPIEDDALVTQVIALKLYSGAPGTNVQIEMVLKEMKNDQ